MTPAQAYASKKKPRITGNTRSKVKPVHKCNLAKMRASLNLSIRDVHRATGMSMAGYYSVELGGDVCLSTMRKLTRFFGKPIEEIWP